MSTSDTACSTLPVNPFVFHLPSSLQHILFAQSEEPKEPEVKVRFASPLLFLPTSELKIDSRRVLSSCTSRFQGPTPEEIAAEAAVEVLASKKVGADLVAWVQSQEGLFGCERVYFCL
jgi:hypothetical protein